MPWTDPFTAIPGQMMTAALWNVQVRDNLNVLKTSIANDGRLNGELKEFREALVALTITAGAVSMDVSLGNVFTLLLTANVTSIAAGGFPAGKCKVVTVRLTQDATGGRTVALPGTWRWAGGGAPPTVSAAANKTDIVVAYSDDGGTTVYASMFTANA